MIAELRRLLRFTGFLTLLASAAWAQVTTLEGSVKGENGQPVKGAVIKLVRTDIKGNYQVKSDKKGHWFYTGLPKGTYDISCEIDGKVVDQAQKVPSKYGDSTTVDFDANRMKAQQAAAASGQVTDEQARSMSPEQKAAMEKQVKERSEAMKKNKELNDTFNAGKQALDAKQFDAAIESLTKASTLDATQIAVWDNLGAAYMGKAAAQPAAEKGPTLDKAVEAYKKVLEIQPNGPSTAAIYNQLGNIYGSQKKMPEATEALNKAAQLDPAMAAKAYYNLGANMVNGGQSKEAVPFFEKAIAADPNYADAHYQLGICMMGEAQVDSKTGKVTPPNGTADHFQKYLSLKPDGPFAQPSQDMLASLGEKVQTNINNPAVTKKGKKN